MAFELGWQSDVLEHELLACKRMSVRRGAHGLQLRGLLDFDEPEPAEDFDDDEEPDDEDDNDGDGVSRNAPSVSAHAPEGRVIAAGILRGLAEHRRTVTNLR